MTERATRDYNEAYEMDCPYCKRRAGHACRGLNGKWRPPHKRRFKAYDRHVDALKKIDVRMLIVLGIDFDTSNEEYVH